MKSRLFTFVNLSKLWCFWEKYCFKTALLITRDRRLVKLVSKQKCVVICVTRILILWSMMFPSSKWIVSIFQFCNVKYGISVHSTTNHSLETDTDSFVINSVFFLKLVLLAFVFRFAVNSPSSSVFSIYAHMTINHVLHSVFGKLRFYFCLMLHYSWNRC